MVKPSAQSKLQLFVLLILLAPLSGHTGPLYKWQDDQGNWHFSDKAPEDQQAKDISQELPPLNTSESSTSPTPPTGSTSAVVESDKDPEQQYLERKRKEAERQKQLMAARCAEARKRLETIQGPVVFIDDAGNEVKVTEEERQRRATTLANEIERYCRGL